MLGKQLVHLNLAGGIQRKDDERLVIPSKLAVADNVEFDDASTVVRRGGQVALNVTSAIPAVPVSGARSLVTNKGSALLLHRNGASKLSPARGSTPVGAALPSLSYPKVQRATANVERVGSVTEKPTAIGSGIPLYMESLDTAMSGNVACDVWEGRDQSTGRTSVSIRVKDLSTGHVFLQDTVTGGAVVRTKPRVLSVEPGQFCLYYAEFASGGTSFDVVCLTFSIEGAVVAGPSVVGSYNTPGTCEGAPTSQVLFDVDFNSATGQLGFVVVDGGTHIHLNTLDSADGSTILATQTETASSDVYSIALAQDVNGVMVAAYSIASKNLLAVQWDVAGATSIGETDVGSGVTSSAVVRMTLVYDDDVGRFKTLYDSAFPGSVTASALRASSFDSALGSLQECAALPADTSWVLAGRVAFSGAAGGRYVVPLMFLSDNFQSTLYLVDASLIWVNLGNVAAATAAGAPWVFSRVDYGELALEPSRWNPGTRVPATVTDSGSTQLRTVYMKYEMDLRLAGGENATGRCVAATTLDFASQLGFCEVNDLTYLAGGCPALYDGDIISEADFHHAPEILGTVTAGSGGLYGLPNISGTYTVCFTVAAQDARGNWHESGPSNQVQVVVTGGSGFYTINPTIIVPPSLKRGVRLLMYRTAVGTNPGLYLATLNDGSSVSASAVSDDVTSGELLYTTAGVLANEPMPACRHIALFQRRLVVSGCSNPNRVFWSKQSLPGYGVEFCASDPTHGMLTPASLGRVVATSEMDDRLVVLCESGVGSIFGTGPSPTGTQGQYSDFNTMITETGAQWGSPRSVVRGPEGVWFRSPYGIRLVSRAGSLARSQDGKQAGAEVDPLVSGDVTAVGGGAKQQVRFYQTSGTVLVWDYQWQQWTRFTGTANIDAVYADGRYYHVSTPVSSALVRYTSDTATRDTNNAGVANQEFNSYIETPWLSFAGIQGFQRIYRLMVVGRNTDSSVQEVTLGGSVGYNFTPTSPPAGETFAVAITPATGGVVQFQHHFAQQKCEALKLGISFKPTGANTGRLRLTDLTLQVGVKQGYYKLPSSQRF